jgi:hypothetical protein
VKIPYTDADRHALYRNLSRELEVSRDERRARGEGLRSAYLTGTTTGARATYNALKAFVKWSAANLHAPDGIRWGCHVPAHFGEKFMPLQEAAADHFATFYNDSGASLVFDLGVKWAHVFDGVVFKVIANGNAPQLWLLSEPSSIGVMREDLPLLSNQEALCHWYDVDLNAFDRILEAALMPAGEREALKKDAADTAAPPRDSGNLMPRAIGQILLAGASPAPLSEISGAISNFPMIAGSLARVTEPCAAMAELWVYDDARDGYRRVIIHKPSLTIVDEYDATKTYGKKSHAFHLLTFDDIPGYLWGASVMEDLIGLQVWRETRMAEIDKREKLYLDPPLLFLGVSSIDDEAAMRFRAPGGNAYSSLPNADVKPILPQMPPDPMGIINAIDLMLDRQSGMSRAGQGEGQPNVRSGEQTMALATLGSPQHRQIALRVEATESDIGTQMFRMMALTDDETITVRGEEGEQFLLNTLADTDATMRIAGHSASPYYEEQIIQRATLAHTRGALDDDEYIGFLGLPREDVLMMKARRRMKAKAEAGQEKMETEKKEVDAKMLRARNARGR